MTQKENKTAWAIALENLGGPALRAYFQLCLEKRLEATPEDAVASYQGTVIEVDADGVATERHLFDLK